jgi:uncharacterized protein (TIGR00375 family)
MQIIADIHNHSRFSRACSPELNLQNLAKTAKIKGVNLLTTADFTHPKWITECEQYLQDQGNGFYILPQFPDINFLFTTELAFIYKKGGKTRRVHTIVLAPNLTAVKKLNATLLRRKINLNSDGRPILGMSDRDFLEMAKEVNKEIEVIPAHIWTPWFSIFGSKSGFDSVEECYGDMSKYIFALETGLSSDPLMNYQISALDKYILVSNSDSHSLQNIAREANVFDIKSQDLSYSEFIRILKEKDSTRFKYTLEFYPEEGRYYYDGHRDCKFVCKPTETKKYKGICPVCKKALTIGVQNRVEELADREYGYIPEGRPAYKKLIELDKVLAEILMVKNRHSKKVQKLFNDILIEYKSEFNVLVELSIDELDNLKKYSLLLPEAIKRVREQKLYITPGYDGEYGIVQIFSEKEKENFKVLQNKLF